MCWMPDLKFDLDDDLSVSDLRRVDEWTPRLQKTGKLRLQRRGETLGVILSAREWKALKARTERAEEALRLVEDSRDRRIVSERENGRPARGKKSSATVDRERKDAGLP